MPVVASGDAGGARSLDTMSSSDRSCSVADPVRAFEMITNDPFDLQRFVEAQKGVIEQVLAELRQGCKRSHWIWFIFPQIHGLGSSRNAHIFAISSAAEATAYLRHPELGPRLRECVELVLQVEGRSLRQILGLPGRSQVQILYDAVCARHCRQSAFPRRAREILRVRIRLSDAERL